jgi:sigma-B regulation protein RsbU (phosphoserine phosphatase)
MLPGEQLAPDPAPSADATLARATVQLLDLLDVELLQELQDQFSALGRLSIQICDAAGNPLTAPSRAVAARQASAASEPGSAACRPGAPASARSVTAAAGGADLAPPGAERQVADVQVHGQRLGSVVTARYPDEPTSPERLDAVASAGDVDSVMLRRELPSPASESERADPEVHKVLAGILTKLCEQRFEVRRRIEELGTVCDMTGILSGTGRLDDVLSAAAAHVCQVMNVDAASIRLADPETGRLILSASHNLSPDALEREAAILDGRLAEPSEPDERTLRPGLASGDAAGHPPEPIGGEALANAMAVPAAYRGDTVGVLHVYSHQRHRFTPFEGVLLRAIGSQIAAAVLNSRLYDQQMAAERYRRQLSYAAEIQQRMIPPVPAHPRITFGAVYDPRLEVGGDFYDFIELPRGHLGVSIADVVGKGVPAALLGASVRSALRAHAHSIFNINEIMSQVNRLLCRDTLVSEFATVFYGVFSPDGSQLTYCNAGHEPPLLLRADEFFRLHTGGMVTGIDPDEPYRMDVVDLQSGDLIVFYTDGLTEALNFYDEPFGRERLMQSIRKYRNLEAPTLASQLLWDVRRFVGLARKTDDSSVVVAKVK